MDLDNKYLKLYAEDFELDLSELKKIDSDKLSKRYNTYLYGYYSVETETIFVFSEGNNKDWLYYAGFEYINKDYSTIIKVNDFYMVTYSHDTRVTDIIEFLESLESED